MLMLFLSFRTENEKEKFEFVYDRYKRLMLKKSFDILHDYELAQDAVSEAFIRVYKNLQKLDDLESGRTVSYLLIITRNISLTILSKQKKTAAADLDLVETADTFDLESSVVENCAANELIDVVNKLKEELKAPFLLKYAYDMSHGEIAKVLKISENNVAVRVHRAKAKLSEMLTKGGVGYEI